MPCPTGLPPDPRRPFALLPRVLVVLVTAGCGLSPPPTASAGPRGDLTVLASASLTETFTTLGRQFESAHPLARLRFGFGAGSALAAQIVADAPADVFASASVDHMDRVIAAGRATEWKAFARNALTVAVPSGNPGHVTALRDLADPAVSVAVCVPTAPCGALASQVFENAGIDVTPVTEEVDVKATLRKVALGEVDAGLVYVTDVRTAGGKVKQVRIPEGVNVSTTYPIGVLSRSPNRQLAQAFVDHVLSGAGAAVLGAAGFSPPEGALPVDPPASPARGTAPASPARSASPRRRSRRRSDPPSAARRCRSRRPLGVSAADPLTPMSLCAAAAVGFLLLPLASLLANTPWQALPRILADARILDTLRLSLTTASAATGVSLLLGVPLAWVLARLRLPGTGLLRALVTLPLVLPPVVGGVALLMALGRSGLVGRHLDSWLHVTFPFTTTGVVLAETFVAMPFLVVTVEGALRSVDRSAEEAAATLGAAPLTVFRRITLPLIAPSLVAGGILCWTRALGEFGATITFAGNFPGTTRTMPLSVYLALENDPDAATALSVVLLGASLISLLLLRDRWLRPGTV
jgi:molybdate transport system permease protein